MARPVIGIALGSGSARGWSHIGVLDALAEAGIKPDVVCGTSIGSLVAAAYVTRRLGELRAWAEAATWSDIVRLLDIRLNRGGLIDGERIVRFLGELGIGGRIEDAAKPFAATATDIATGREVWLREGPIVDAVRASIALPGIFSPVHRNGGWLLDGGLVNPVPVSVCRALGAEIIIAVNLNGDLLGRRLTAARAEADADETEHLTDRLLAACPARHRTASPRSSAGCWHAAPTSRAILTSSPTRSTS